MSPDLVASGLEILYQDEQLLAVNKPPWLLSVPGRGPEKQDSVVYRLAQHLPGIREVHRLDWETSGLLLLALNPDSHRHLSRQFQQREVTKRYLAVVHGRVAQQQGEIDLPLRCDWPNRPRQMVDHQLGKPALTHWQCLGSDQYSSRLSLRPVTGRSHQLRVHLLSIGHPIAGDPLYGHDAAQQLAPRLLLHACELGFRHPTSGESMLLHSPAPF